MAELEDFFDESILENEEHRPVEEEARAVEEEKTVKEEGPQNKRGHREKILQRWKLTLQL